MIEGPGQSPFWMISGVILLFSWVTRVFPLSMQYDQIMLLFRCQSTTRLPSKARIPSLFLEN